MCSPEIFQFTATKQKPIQTFLVLTFTANMNYGGAMLLACLLSCVYTASGVRFPLLPRKAWQESRCPLPNPSLFWFQYRGYRGYREFHTLQKEPTEVNKIYSFFEGNIFKSHKLNRFYGFQDYQSQEWLRDLDSLPINHPIQQTRKMLNNDEEFWGIFKLVGFNLNLLQIVCKMKVSAYGNNRTKQPEKYTDLDFIPSQVDLHKCLSSLEEQEKNFKTDHLLVPNFYWEILRGKLFNLAKKTNNSTELPFVLNQQKRVVPAYSAQDLLNFLVVTRRSLGNSSLESTSFLLIPVISGVSFQLFYRHGFLENARTTDLGREPVDLTDLIRTMPNIPKLLPGQKEEVITHGTLFINQQDFQLLNVARQRNGQNPLPDTRSLVAHTILTAEEPNKNLGLKLKCNFDYFTIDGKLPNLKTFSSVRKKMQELGFPVILSEHVKVCEWKDIPFTAEKAKELDYPFEISAIEIGINNITERKLAPYETCSYKLFPTFHETVVNRIDFKVLSNGTIVAVIYTNPIQTNAKPISTFWIGNQTDFKTMDIRVGDTILISTSQKTHPQILKSYKNSTNSCVQFPKNCPKCKSVLTETTTSEGRVVACCSAHLSCKDDSVNDIAHFVSAQGLHVPSLTKELITQLKEKLIISSSVDIFSLSMEDYIFLTNISKETFEQILEEIKTARHTTLARFLYALKIPSITPIMAEDLAYAAGTIDRLSQMSKKELLATCRYNDKQAIDQVITFFSDKKKNNEINALLSPNNVQISSLNQEVMELCFKTTYTEIDYEKIIRKIKQCKQDYSITDFEFDILMKTAKKIETDNPKWILPKSSEKNKKQSRSIHDPISAISKTYSVEEIKTFIKKDNSFGNGIVVEPKIDGIALSLFYRNGKLVDIFSKHNNKNMMALDLNYAVKIEKIPKNLKQEFTGIVRGELFITDNNFNKINEELRRAGLEQYKDSLSAVISSLHIRNIVRNSLFDAMSFFGYHIVTDDFDLTLPRSSLHQYLEELGFKCDFDEKPLRFFHSVQEAITYISDASARRREFKTSIDGMVLKQMKQSQEGNLYAYKFASETRQSKLKKVHFNLTQSGDISAVAEIEPVEFSNGRTLGFIQLYPRILKNLYEGDRIDVTFSGGVRPIISDIIRQNRKKGANQVQIPTTCPSCDQMLSVKESGTLHCINTKCVGPRDMSLKYFAQCMGFGHNTTIKKIIELGFVRTPFDFYKISLEDLVGQSGLSYQNIQNLLFSIEASKSSSMLKFLESFRIPGASSKTCQQIVAKVNNFEEFLQLTTQDLINMGVRVPAAKTISEYTEKNKNDIQWLEQILKKNRKDRKDRKDRKEIGMDPKQIQRRFFMRQSDIKQVIQSLQKTLRDNMDTNNHDLNILKLSLDKEDELRQRLERAISFFGRETSKVLSGMSKYVNTLDTNIFTPFSQKTEPLMDEQKEDPK